MMKDERNAADELFTKLLVLAVNEWRQASYTNPQILPLGTAGEHNSCVLVISTNETDFFFFRHEILPIRTMKLR